MRWLFRNRAPAKPAGSSSADHAAMGRSSPTPTYGPNPISEVEPKTALSVLSDPPKTSDSNQPPPPSILVADLLPGITEGIPHSNAKPPFSGGQKYPRLVLPRPLFALLIGIDKYEHYPPLFGAVKDMECISDFLTNSLAVPNNRITKLLDNEATKDAIVKMIRSLANSSDIIRNDAILIYFAGHGARATAPHGWPTNDGYIETICPVDISALPTAEPLVTGIPDLVLNMLITQLAEEKGDNITVIFDCCHSASSLRGEQVAESFRAIDNPLPIIAKEWEDVLSLRNFNRDKGADNIRSRSLECSVLLAACGKQERAGEGPQGGLFTQRLLGYIGSLSNERLSGLTYTELIRSLSISDSQHPQCEGSLANRLLFRSEKADQSYIYGCKGPKGEFLLDVGEPLGIEPGTRFNIYGKDTSPDNQCCGCLVVKEVSESKSILSFIEGQPKFVVPDPFYAVQRCLPEDKKLRIYCSDEATFKETLLRHQCGFGHFATLVNVRGDADLLVSISDRGSINSRNCKECGVDINKEIFFDWADDNIITRLSRSRIGNPFSIDNPKKIKQILQAAAKFHHYLYIGESGHENDEIEMAFRRLSTHERVNIGGFPIKSRSPEGKNILEDEPPSIQLEEGKQVGPFGLTIFNYTDKDLFPQVFWFEGSNLSITPWYTSQHTAGYPGAKARVEAPLRALKTDDDCFRPGEFPLGYGDVPVDPWGFSSDGSGIMVGFFKVFLTTFNADYAFLAQESPFDRGVLIRTFDDGPVDWWTTRRATIVQLPPKPIRYSYTGERKS